MSRTPEPEYLTIAWIRKVRGRRGEVAAEVLTDFPERFQPGREMRLAEGGVAQALFLEESWFHKGLAILKFRGIETISAAESLVGSSIQIPRSERRQLPPGRVYLADLVGCVVLEGEIKLGTVQTIDETGAVPLLNLSTSEGELLIPFARDICEAVDLEKKEIRVRLPEGLKELNRKEPSGPKPRVLGRHRRRPLG